MIIGIDGGLDGGIVVMEPSTGKIFTKSVMPVIGKKGKGKRQYDVPSMTGLLSTVREPKKMHSPSYVEHVFIERAQAMPGQGVSSMFSIGYGYGLWQGICTALGMPFTIVAPKAWQKVMFEGVNKTDTKQASARIAGRLAPDEDWRASERCKKPHSGLTDAYCIAEYGLRKMANQL